MRSCESHSLATVLGSARDKVCTSILYSPSLSNFSITDCTERVLSFHRCVVIWDGAGEACTWWLAFYYCNDDVNPEDGFFYISSALDISDN